MTAVTSFRALGTTAAVAVCDDAALPDARRVLELELAHIDRACSRFRDDSELAHANARAGEPVHVTALFAEAVAAALAAAAATDGIVSPALGGALAAAGYDVTFEVVRARAQTIVRPVPPRPDAWRGIELDVERRQLTVPRGVELDLGATAKALAADRAAAAIVAATGTGALVSLGGDVAVAGPAPAGGWAVRIAEDHAAIDADGPVVGIDRGGLATSSTTVRAWRTSAGSMHHVLDPRTARPAASGWRTISVAASTCLAANVASTAALVGGTSYLRGLHARLVADDGSVHYVGAWPRDAVAA
ncbi:MAG TPA: FAD:protein FMN transferase [Gaiellaceae bacterium]